MGINTYTLQSVKKELQHLDQARLAELCLRLAKYKKESKELLTYLLFEAHDVAGYTDGVKQEMDGIFMELPSHAYNAAKALRKILRLVTKHSRFIASKPAEIELLIHFCKQYVEYVDKRANYKPLRQILIRQLEKVVKLISALHEDLQYDHRTDLESVVNEADAKLSWINKKDYL